METMTDENQLNLDEVLENEETYVEKKTIYPIKAIAVIIASLITIGTLGGLWANAENKAHYESQEQKLYQEADSVISDWSNGFESITDTTLVIGEPQQTYAKAELESELQDLKRYSALSVVKMDGLAVEISSDKTWNFIKEGEVVHRGQSSNP